MLAARVLAVRKTFLLRAFIGRRPDDHILRRVVRRFRNTRLARMVFGLVHGDALDPDEIDQMILMPSVIVACGLFLTALFLLDDETITRQVQITAAACSSGKVACPVLVEARFCPWRR